MGDGISLDPRIFDIILNAFTSVISLRWTTIGDEGLAILGALATISLMIMVAGWMFAGQDLLSNLFYTGCQFAVLLMMITELHFIVGMFVNTFVWTGLNIGGGQMDATDFLTPSKIFLEGEKISEPILLYIQHMKGYVSTPINMGNIVVYSFFLWVIWACFWLMAVHIVLAVVQVQIMAAMSLILLPWLVFSPTAAIGKDAVGKLISGFIRLGMLAAVTSLSVPVFVLIGTPGMDVSHWQTALAVAVGSGILALLNWTAPSIASRFIGGGDFIALGAAFVFGALRLRR